MNSHQKFLKDQADKDKFFQAFLQEAQFGKEYAPEDWDYAINLNKKEIREHLDDPKKTIVMICQIDKYRYRCRVKEGAD